MWILAVFNFLACFNLKITKFKFYGFCFIMTQIVVVLSPFAYVFTVVLFVFLSKCQQDEARSMQLTSIKLSRIREQGQRENPLKFWCRSALRSLKLIDRALALAVPSSLIFE